jgi:hypothetical protein
VKAESIIRSSQPIERKLMQDYIEELLEITCPINDSDDQFCSEDYSEV